MALSKAKLSTLRGYDCQKLRQRHNFLKSQISGTKAKGALAYEIEKTEKALSEKTCRITHAKDMAVPRKPTRPHFIKDHPKPRKIIPAPKPVARVDISQCPYGMLKPEIKVDDDFKVHSSLKNGLKREMIFACPVGDMEGNKCVANQIMRFRRIARQNKKCLTEKPIVRFSKTANKIWEENNEAGREAIEKFENEMKEWEKAPWGAKPKKPVMLTIPQQKNTDIIRGRKSLID